MSSKRIVYSRTRNRWTLVSKKKTIQNRIRHSIKEFFCNIIFRGLRYR